MERTYFEKIKEMPITIMILVANIIAFLLCMVKGGDVFSLGGINYKYITMNHEYVRFITYMFLHANVMHIVNNMLILFLLARTIEPKLGSFRMILIYLSSGVLGGIFSMYIHQKLRPDQLYFSVGASAAVYGILCTAFILKFRSEDKTRPEDLAKALGVVVIYSLASARGGVDAWGHLGGGVAGGILAYILTVKKWEDFYENMGLKIIGLLICFNVCVVGVCGANIGGEPKSLPDDRVDFIKAQYVDGRNETYGELLEDSCYDLKWEGFISTEGQDVVEVTGMVYYQRRERDMLIQFALYNNNTSFEVWYISLDGEALNRRDIQKFLGGL